jgi:tRNA G46 methylase TrmB
MHNVYLRVFDDRLIFPPFNRLRRVLDCGYGSGSWAADVAERNPDCEVIGVDINPSMHPEEVPDNLYLQMDNLNRK